MPDTPDSPAGSTTKRDPGSIEILELGGEGGGATVWGLQTDGLWQYWHEGSYMDFDDNMEDFWKSDRGQAVADLAQALPVWWLQAHPLRIHPDFLAKIRELYTDGLGKLSAHDRRMHNRYRREAWQALQK